METRTHLTGKDAALEDTIEKATSLLKGMGIEIHAVSWLNPAPNCWSVHIQAVSCRHLYTNGKGTSRLACLASGLGEFLERLSTNFFFADYFLCNGDLKKDFYFYPNESWFLPGNNGAIPSHNKYGTELLNVGLQTFYNPSGELRAEHLLDNNTNDADLGICALPFQSLLTGQTTYFPVSILNNLYVSNGMAAGNSPEESCSQALSEIIERYVKNIIISQGISLPDVPDSILKQYPKLCIILDTLMEEKLLVRVKDASLGGKFPVICALLTDAENGGVYGAFGANCRFETAVERTLTELLQGRSLNQLKDFHPPCHDMDQVADPFNLESHFVDSDGLLSWKMFKDKADFMFSPWDFSGSTLQEFQQLQRLITDIGFEIYRAEYLHSGMYCCRFLVPGMSEVYPVDDLVWNNRGTGSILRSHLVNLPLKNYGKLRQFFDLLESLNLNDQQLVSHTIGIIFDANSAWSTLRIGELKALTLLALNQSEDALDWCTWCLDSGALPEKRTRMYRLLQTFLNFQTTGENIGDYGKSLHLFYNSEEIHQAESILAGTTTFPGLNFASTWTEISIEHKNLLKIYEHVNSFKTSFTSFTK